MSGDIVDSNSTMIAQQLKEFGIEVKRKVTVADDFELLVNEINSISQQADVLIINGGLGPTTDDLTAEALAAAANIKLTEHPQALEHITSWCQQRGAELSAPNLKQTILPEGCNIIANTVGSAVGFNLTLNDCDIYCTPGVPHELKVMIDNEITEKLQKKLPETLEVHTTRLQVFGYGESALQKLLTEQFPDFPEALEIGYRASMPLLELKLTSRTTQDKILKQQWLEKIKKSLNDHIIHEITDKPSTLAKEVFKLLQKNKHTLTCAESCTGGLIASLLTREPGASSSFHAGFVSYSNDIKESLLDVSPKTIQQHGAVSQETVIAMAKGALKKSSSDYTIAVSGIAGPDGGSDEKPVGTVWIAWGDRHHIDSISLQIKANRWYFQQSVAAISLDLIRRLLIGSTNEPRYFVERKTEQKFKK